MPRRDMPATLVAELCEHEWPGNVRQLEKIVEAYLVSGGNHASLSGLGSGGGLADDWARLCQADYRSAKSAAVKAFQKRYMKAVLDSCNGDLTETARKMKISRYGLQKILEQLES